MSVMPFIPEFSSYKERNTWIKKHAEYFTVIVRKNRSYMREEENNYFDALARAEDLIRREPSHRVLIYAVYQHHDALAATVSTEGVKEHD